jgi:hypothetical protein
MGSRSSKRTVKPELSALAVVKPVAPQAPAPDETREELIALAAYYRAERRGFEPGGELQDWLAAEAEVDEALRTRQAQR